MVSEEDSLAKTKLELEILSLRKNNRRYVQFLPLATAFVAVGGLVFGVIQFQAGQTREVDSRERERRTTVQGQIRSDQGEIMKFAEDKNQTLSRTSFLLWSLDRLMDSEGSQPADAPAVRESRRVFTESLVNMIGELDIEMSPRDLSFPLIALTHWRDYEPYLREHPEKLEVILNAYVSALRDLRTKDAGFIKDMDYSEDTKKFSVHDQYYDRPRESQTSRRFLDIFNGFTAYLKLMETNPTKRDRILKKFASALCNNELAGRLWGKEIGDTPCKP